MSEDTHILGHDLREIGDIEVVVFWICTVL